MTHDSDEPVDPDLERIINELTSRGFNTLHEFHDDSAQANEQTSSLHAWVRWLRERYNLDQREVPPCWSQHPDLIEELAALRAAHAAAYAPDAFPTAALDWHHAFWLTRERLRHWVARTGCRRGEHRSASRSVEDVP